MAGIRSSEVYEEQTVGWLVLALMPPVQGIIAYLYVAQAGDRPLGALGFALFELLMMAVVLLFFRMQVRADSRELVVTFGIGLIRKSVALSDIAGMRPVRSPWYYGWGIRYIPNGTLYTMSGSGAVELRLKNTSRVVWIGTADPQRLMKEIAKRLV